MTTNAHGIASRPFFIMISTLTCDQMSSFPACGFNPQLHCLVSPSFLKYL